MAKSRPVTVKRTLRVAGWFSLGVWAVLVMSRTFPAVLKMDPAPSFPEMVFWPLGELFLAALLGVFSLWPPLVLGVVLLLWRDILRHLG